MCEVRPFTFDEFPKHVRSLSTYAFKPIILQVRNNTGNKGNDYYTRVKFIIGELNNLVTNVTDDI